MSVLKHLNILKYATTTTTTTTPIPTTTTTSLSTTASNENAIKSSLTSSVPTSAPKFCQPKYERHVQFPKTESGTNAKTACPVNTDGLAEWFCSIDGKWEGSPDLSKCISIWIKKLDADIQNSPEDSLIQLEALKEIHTHSKRQQLVGGELIKISSIIEKVVLNYVNIMKSVIPSKENHHKNLEMNKVIY
uniref:G-protein coupled receptors family 2 profile 1 domain-containing protein n=1 Tax=Panagrolaimus superbus TaxID=310955 RepID=A0A914YNJ5_9BILA